MLLSIAEHDDPDGARLLTLTGELDISSAPKLRERLRDLGAAHRTVRLDLSQLDFIDSSGIEVMVFGLRGSARDGWGLEVQPDMPRQVRRVFEITRLDRQFWPLGHPALEQSGRRTNGHGRLEAALRRALVQ